MTDSVNHPLHYTSHPSGIECIIIAQYHDFCVGNAIKYLWRAGLKSEQGKTDTEKEIEDLRKAAWYIQQKITLLENLERGKKTILGVVYGDEKAAEWANAQGERK